ncbi:MAG: gamma-glutamylcyclotransferase [Candidatus Thioglobus sp.]|uniref:gamma-glutamylcyclotransferase family protein n=1 Tax=Candidatus Thioglobus sp. TaxID=2026721 RepID=UPI002631E10D|nr:gamma-glutamylcyclotransferase family protein [Candidatus Thioglobus sp.]MDC9727569.1 gamma-glutamylcyclotransferase [Candidatus Thioglobus sp.]
MINETVLLFSYGTLQNSTVQQKTFGRELVGYKDELLNYKLEMIKIQDKRVVKLSGEACHPIAVSSQSDTISGKVFEISAEELAQSDEYEVDEYQRVLGEMVSGIPAWVYVECKE